MQVLRLMRAGRNESVLRTSAGSHRSYGMQKTSDFRIGWVWCWKWRNSSGPAGCKQVGFLHSQKPASAGHGELAGAADAGVRRLCPPVSSRLEQPSVVGFHSGCGLR